MKRLVLTALCLSPLVACDEEGSNKTDNKVAALQAEVAALTVSLADVQARLAAAESNLTGAQAQVSDVDARLARREAIIQITAEDDVVFEGANVNVRDGSGDTDGANGKGNLIVGYNEPPNRCVGGPRDGEFCTSEASCAEGGTCEPAAAPYDRGGSHNLIVGKGHTYMAAGGVAFGQGATIWDGSVLGGYGNTAINGSVVVGGALNTAGGLTGTGAVVLGGEGNSTVGDWVTVPAIP